MKNEILEDIRTGVILLAVVAVLTSIYYLITKSLLIPETKIEKIVIEKASPVEYDYKGEYELTWYCEGTKTASGNKVNHNLTAAADINSGLKFNDVVYIESLKMPVVIHDTGSAVKGNILDIYVNDCSQALKNGRQTSKVYLIGG